MCKRTLHPSSPRTRRPKMPRHRESAPLVALLGGLVLSGGVASVASLAISRKWRERNSTLHRILIDVLLNALTAGDAVTARHSRRVADLTDALASTLGLSLRERATLRVAALLHDMGKIDDKYFHIVHQAQRLDSEERSKIKGHPHESAHILRPLERIHPGIIGIVESHHECWGGGGYPSGLRGDEIPLGARAISLADVFDALTQPRSYHAAMSVEKAIEELRGETGSRFDPELVQKLEEPALLNRWRDIAERGREVEEREACLTPADNPTG